MTAAYSIDGRTIVITFTNMLLTSLALLKIDMKNAFNECSRTAFFERVAEDFPEISAWVKWCYSHPAELRFGSRRIMASSGVQQGVVYILT